MKFDNGEEIVIGIRGPKGEKIEIIDPRLVYDGDMFMDNSVDVFYEALTKLRSRYAKIKKK